MASHVAISEHSMQSASQSVHDMALIIAASPRALSDMRGIREDLARLGFSGLDLKAAGLAVTRAKTMRRDAVRMFGETRATPQRLAECAAMFLVAFGLAALALTGGQAVV
jgi:hypothetical protein